MNKLEISAVVLVALAFAAVLRLQGGEITIPNGSFESPTTLFVSTEIDFWQKSPKPDWFDESDGFLWSQLTGLFKNTPVGSADHIDNCDGNQAIWLFAVPEVGLVQESSLAPGGGLPPTQRLDAIFRVGSSYQLSAGIIGMGGGMSNGVTLELGVFFRDAASNRVTVAAISVTNSPTVFSNRTNLVEFRIQVPTVTAEDPWANHPLGISLLSTVGFDLQGGYWDLDNIHLTETRAAVLTVTGASRESFMLRLESEPGLAFDILTSTSVTLPVSEWVRLTTLTNITGISVIPEARVDSSARFYRARELTSE